MPRRVFSRLLLAVIREACLCDLIIWVLRIVFLFLPTLHTSSLKGDFSCKRLQDLPFLWDSSFFDF